MIGKPQQWWVDVGEPRNRSLAIDYGDCSVLHRLSEKPRSFVLVGRCRMRRKSKIVTELTDGKFLTGEFQFQCLDPFALRRNTLILVATSKYRLLRSKIDEDSWSNKTNFKAKNYILWWLNPSANVHHGNHLQPKGLLTSKDTSKVEILRRTLPLITDEVWTRNYSPNCIWRKMECEEATECDV